MPVYFLAAADGTPLTKTISSSFGQLSKSAYPNVRNFVSHDVPVNNINDLFLALSVHAEQHHCLLKGNLLRQLNNESRQGATNANDSTSWIVFDIDNLPYNSIDTFLSLLPENFQHASHIVQYSSSHGFSPGLRAHVFFWMNEPAMAPAIKLWMKKLNLENPRLRELTELAAGGFTLKWPLDISVNQNDKLIYIAPPICNGIADPVTARIAFVERENSTVSLDLALNAAAIQTAENNRINELRAAAGLEKRKLRTKTMDGLTILQNADPMVMTAPPFEERGFVYIPLGNNRHAYYHPIGKHEFLYTFKDPDVAYPMNVVLPSYFWECERAKRPNDTDQVILAFRDRRTDVKYIGSYDSTFTTACFNRIRAREDINDFFVQHHVPSPDTIETWDYEFNPTTDKRIDPDNHWINKFVPTQFMGLKGGSSVPPKIQQLLKHIMNNDEECYEHFLNWLAYKYQTRKKCKTAWFFQGVEGTGKGVLYNKVLRPIFGAEYCHIKRMDTLLDRFNAELETSLLWVIDEANIEDFKDDGQIIEKLKNLIVEEQQVIRAMHTNPFNATNYTDLILFSNQSLAIKISATDRRYNICPRQNTPLIEIMRRADIDTIELEAIEFARFLGEFDACEEKAATPLDNEAKQLLVNLGRNTHDEFFHNLGQGNISYFAHAVADTPDLGLLRHHAAANDLVKNILIRCENNKTTLLSLSDIARLYVYIVAGGRATSAQKIQRMLMFKGMNVTQGATERSTGSIITWNVDDVTLRHLLNELSSTSTSFQHGQQTRTQAD